MAVGDSLARSRVRNAGRHVFVHVRPDRETESRAQRCTRANVYIWRYTVRAELHGPIKISSLSVDPSGQSRARL